MEYDTREVAHGRKIQVRHSPFHFKSLLFRIDARINASVSMIGT